MIEISKFKEGKMIDNIKVSPGLFGITNSNRDFSSQESWGKNQFNSSFPAALACYLHFKGLKAVYIKTDETLKPIIEYISIDELFGCNPLSDNIYFAFETAYLPFQKYLIGSMPRNDLVIQNLQTNASISSLEIKLTALPDNTTCSFDESEFGSEIVVRPDTIIYLACSIIQQYKDIKELAEKIQPIANKITDWINANGVIPYIYEIKECLLQVIKSKKTEQSPIIMEPIWKTNGKSPQLAERCLDVFVWSNFALFTLFLPDNCSDIVSIGRHTRTMIWLFKMLSDYVDRGRFNGKQIIDELSYNTKNDKAFATNGIKTHRIMSCKELTTPRISKKDIKHIILGGGQNLLSPERRFDAIIYNSPDLFVEE